MTPVIDRLLDLPPARQRELLARFLAAVPSWIHEELERAVTVESQRVHRPARALMHFREVYQVFGLKGATSYQARRLAAEGKIIEVRLGPRTLRYCPESVARYRERLVGGWRWVREFF